MNADLAAPSAAAAIEAIRLLHLAPRAGCSAWEGGVIVEQRRYACLLAGPQQAALQRHRIVLAWLDSGATRATIATRLGVSRGRAQQLCASAEIRRRTHPRLFLGRDL